MNPEKVSWLQKAVTKHLRVMCLRHPPEAWVKDHSKDFVMALHYCRVCHVHRFDRHYDTLSRAARFICGGCETLVKTSPGYGGSLLVITECMETARKISTRNIYIPFVFLRFLLFGLGKYLPADRDGKTAGELESEITHQIIDAVCFLDKIRNH